MKVLAMRNFRGFTLIEMMIVVLIISVLVAIAYPSYTEHVQRSRIADATATLADLRVRMERFYQDNRSFMNGAVCGTPMPAAGSFGYRCDGGVNAGGQDWFRVTATGAAGMVGFEFTVNENNLRRTVWFQGVRVDQNCWMTRRGERC